MRIVLLLAIIINILSIIVLSIGLFHKFEHPKNKANYGYFIAGCMLMYILMLSFAAIYGLIIHHYLYCIVLFLCVISPFVIGKFVKHETLAKYTIAQIMCFIVSLIVLIQKF